MRKSKQSQTAVFHWTIVLLALPILLSAGPIANAQRVGVMPFENVNQDSSMNWLSLGIPETIMSDLQYVNGIVLVERTQLRNVMREQSLQLTGAIDEATVIKVGKLVGADILVVGAYQKQDETIRLTARFVKVQSGDIIRTAKATGNLSDIFTLQDQIVNDLINNLKIVLNQNELNQLAIKPTESLEAYKHFGQGSLLEAKMDYTGAFKEIKKATEVDPNFTIANQKFNDIFLSLNKKNYWTYETTSESPDFGKANVTTTDKAGARELFNNLSVFSYFSESIVQTSNGSRTQGYTFYYIKKDDGIYMVGDKLESKDTQPNVLLVSYYEPPYLTYPYDMEVGKKWNVQSKVKVTTGDLSFSGSVKLGEEREVVQRETITVPAGTFDCYVIEIRQKSKAGAFIFSVSGTNIVKTWFSQGVGIIKTRTETIKGGKTIAVSEKLLKEYHIE